MTVTIASTGDVFSLSALPYLDFTLFGTFFLTSLPSFGWKKHMRRSETRPKSTIHSSARATVVFPCYLLLIPVECPPRCFPFSGPGYPELYKSILKGAFRLPDWLSPAANSLVRGMLVTDPTCRFTFRQVRQLSICQTGGASHRSIGWTEPGRDSSSLGQFRGR